MSLIFSNLVVIPPEFIDQYYGRVIFALIRLRLACVTPK